MTFPDEVLVPLSALEHWSYCPRQCALIHREQTFDENLYTLRGRAVHERVDGADRHEALEGIRIERGVALWSDRLGLVGKADVIEFALDGTPYPVEYKSGGARTMLRHAALQLCAQALCLEEMLGRPVPKGALFFAATKRRQELEFDEELRARTLSAVEAVRQVLGEERLPVAPADERCPKCSLFDSCFPYVLAARRRASLLQRDLFTPRIVREALSDAAG